MRYEATITFTQEEKTIKEQIIVEDCELFAEVEAKLYEKEKGYEDVDVTAIKRSKIKEIANERTSDDEKIFLATLVDVFLNDDGSEKEMKYTIAFFSKTMDSAHAYISQYASQGYNMSVTKIIESKFVDVLK